MMKSLKGKVITGTVAFGLLASAGAVFAGTDAGTNLKGWYDGQFNHSVDSIAKSSGDHIKGQVPGLTKEYKNLKADATNSVNATRDGQIADVQSAVQKDANDQIASLTGEQGDIQAKMDAQFAAISTLAKSQINSAGKQFYDLAQKDLSKQTTADGNAALQQVDQQLTASNQAAVQQLTDAIAQAKKQLQAQIDADTLKTTGDINAAIDAKIVELRGQITDTKNQLVATQQALITAKAQELENSAKADLDAAVASINN